jgi:hypothetical protein
MKTAREVITDARLGNTHWGRRILRAERNGAFTEKDYDDSNQWTTCACGKQDQRLFDGGSPWDSHLRQLGYQFTSHVQYGRHIEDGIVWAAETLVYIEETAKELLAGMAGRTCQLA